jgi:thiosulfate/3-mercaptopyruvate sulfurtransferase
MVKKPRSADNDNLTIIFCAGSKSPREKARHADNRIPGSILISPPMIEASEDESRYRHMLPDMRAFQKVMKDLDIRKDDVIVCYDEINHITSSRVSWVLRTFGCTKVSVLSGTFEKWVSEKQPLEHGEDESAFSRKGIRLTEPEDSSYAYLKDRRMYATHDDVLDIVEYKGPGAPIILDSRKPNCSHYWPVTKAVPFHFRKVQNSLKHKFGAFKSSAEMEELFKTEGGLIDPQNEKIVVSGTVGITCCVLEVALSHLGNKNVMVYDGSHQEWKDKSGLRIDGEYLQYAPKVGPNDKQMEGKKRERRNVGEKYRHNTVRMYFDDSYLFKLTATIVEIVEPS